MEKVELFRELCDCGENVMHFNGGNYHRVINLYYDDTMVVLEDTTTQDDFLDAFLTHINGHIFRTGEASVIWKRED